MSEKQQTADHSVHTGEHTEQRRLLTDGGEDAKVVGERDEEGIGVLGEVTAETGENYGIKGTVASTGYGLYTPDDAKISGNVDADGDWTVETESGADAGSVTLGHSDNDGDTAGATISGGGTQDNENTVTAAFGTVSGGYGNSVSGEGGTVPGGIANSAQGASAVALGRSARAVHDGAVVIGDSTTTELWSEGPDELRVQMPVYAKEFNTTSASTAKTGIEPVDPEAVLNGVKSLSLATWSFHDSEGTRHMGPLAEEFSETFDLGRTDQAIATVDADGVALASVQGLVRRFDRESERLHEEIAARDERIERLESSLESLSDRLATVESQLNESQYQEDSK